jgi:hypothetical protein
MSREAVSKSHGVKDQQPVSPVEQHRLHHNGHDLNSPCFIHSHLDNVLESSRKESSYFDAHNPAASSSSTQRTDQREDNGNISKSVLFKKINHDRNRPEPRHRGAQGATEPESESEGEEGSDASTSRNGSSGSYSSDGSTDSQDESDRVRSLTRQLAETAVGVREMSKQLGVLTESTSEKCVIFYADLSPYAFLLMQDVQGYGRQSKVYSSSRKQGTII